MTPVLLDRIMKDVDEHFEGMPTTFVLTSGDSIEGTWEWMNKGAGGLDAVIIVTAARKALYIAVETIEAVMVPIKRKR